MSGSEAMSAGWARGSHLRLIEGFPKDSSEAKVEQPAFTKIHTTNC